MVLIKISNKHSKLRQNFEHPIVLNPEKKNTLGVTHLLFSLNQTFNITNFMLEFINIIIYLSRSLATC